MKKSLFFYIKYFQDENLSLIKLSPSKLILALILISYSANKLNPNIDNLLKC